MDSPDEAHGLTLSSHQIIIEQFRQGEKVPGLEIGFTIMIFIHEFSHYLRRYNIHSIGEFYQKSSPIRINPQPRNLSEEPSMVATESEERKIHFSEEKEEFLQEARLRAEREDSEEVEYDWMGHFERTRNKEPTIISTSLSIWRRRDLAKSIVKTISNKKGGEGGENMDASIFGSVYPGVTLAAAKTLVAACMRRTPIDLVRFQSQIANDMREARTAQTYATLRLQRGRAEIVETSTTANLHLSGCVAHSRVA